MAKKSRLVKRQIRLPVEAFGSVAFFLFAETFAVFAILVQIKPKLLLAAVNTNGIF